MATWSSVESYLFSNYTCEKIDNGVIKLQFAWNDTDRVQVVLVVPSGPDHLNPTWMDMHSPIGPVESIDLAAAVRETINFAAGGLSVFAGILTVRNSIPLADLDAGEIDGPLGLLSAVGDRLEQMFTGQDVY